MLGIWDFLLSNCFRIKFALKLESWTYFFIYEASLPQMDLHVMDITAPPWDYNLTEIVIDSLQLCATIGYLTTVNLHTSIF